MDNLPPEVPPSRASASASLYPALSISKPPPRRERVMNYVLWGLFGSALALGLAGIVAHWMQAP
ncbi:MAG: hypothetical protein JWN48_3657 [Myxococcaceae bacterium]|nr:hypothetical protein [Myxococcaceae bacterium]